MKRKYDGYMNILRKPIGILFVIITLMLLSQVFGADLGSRLMGKKKFPITETHKKQIAKKIASDYGLGPFKPSLEMKECADFLLTPALLVQEALSDDIVITYPTE